MDGIVVLAAAAALAAAALLYQAIGAARDRRRFATPGALASVGRHRLHYRSSGTGTPAVVFDAGIAASSLTWSRVQPAIAEVTRAVSYDRAGLAWSESTSIPRSMATLVSELRLLLQRADAPPPYVLVGHSFGGLVIRAFARAHPDEVAGLVFVDPLHPEEWCDPSPQQRRMLRGGIFLSRIGALLARAGIVRLSLAMLSGGAPGAPRQFSRMFGRQAAALLEHMVGEVQKLPQEVLPSVQAHWSSPKAFRGMWQHLAALPICSSEVMQGTDAFGNTPVVVFSAGARHPRWLAADAALAHASSNGRHVVAPHGGHWVHLDHPDMVIQRIRDVIADARAANAVGRVIGDPPLADGSPIDTKRS
jgi:pimeloyl-ACP methyl ester carboxylesterase